MTDSQITNISFEFPEYLDLSGDYNLNLTLEDDYLQVISFREKNPKNGLSIVRSVLGSNNNLSRPDQSRNNKVHEQYHSFKEMNTIYTNSSKALGSNGSFNGSQNTTLNDEFNSIPSQISSNYCANIFPPNSLLNEFDLTKINDASLSRLQNRDDSPDKLNPPPPPSVSSLLPYPAKLIDELVRVFFANIPPRVNCVHPRSYCDERYQRPRLLLYTICSIACRYSNISNQNVLLAENMKTIGAHFYRLAMSEIDPTDRSLDTLSALVLLLGDDIIREWNVLAFGELSKLVERISNDIRLHTDPDIYESIYTREPWNLIKKETFRRLFLRVSMFGVQFQCQPTTKLPLPIDVWESLPDDIYYITEMNTQMATPPKRSQSFDPTLMMGKIAVLVRRIHALFKLAATADKSDVSPDAETKAITITLLNFQKELSYLYPLESAKPTTEADWTIVYLHMSTLNLVLLAHRYFFIRFLESLHGQVTPGATKPVISEELFLLQLNAQAESFQTCQYCVDLVVEIMRDIVLVNDPNLVFNSVEKFTIAQSIVCLGVMKYYGSVEARQENQKKYEFLKDILRRLNSNGSLFAGHILTTFEVIESTGWINAAKMLEDIFLWKITQYFSS